MGKVVGVGDIDEMKRSTRGLNRSRSIRLIVYPIKGFILLSVRRYEIYPRAKEAYR